MWLVPLELQYKVGQHLATKSYMASRKRLAFC
jgi:hypothetical protein